MENIKGACRCGQLSYELSKAPVYAAYCHCTECRQRNSSPCTSFMMGLQDSLNVLGKYDEYSEASGSGSTLDHHRCINCGTVVYSRINRLKNIVAIPSTTLLDEKYFQPVEHLWVQSKVSWFEISDDLPQRSGPPKLPAGLLNN